jgi:hypothetical protein
VRFASVYAALAKVGECYSLRPLMANVDIGVNQNVNQLPADPCTHPSRHEGPGHVRARRMSRTIFQNFGFAGAGN